MPRDYVKSRSHQPARSRTSGPSGFVWLLVGVLMGLIIAGVFYVKNQNRHPKQPIVLPSPQTPAKAGAADEKKPSAQNLQTQFDFYNVLPSQKVTGPTGDEAPVDDQPKPVLPPPEIVTPPAATSPNPAAESPKPILPTPAVMPVAAPPKPAAAKPVLPPPAIQIKPAATPKPPASYTVQIATVSSPEEADKLKAQLSLMGFEVKVSALQKNGKTSHRVWLGKFKTLSEADAIQKQLQENKISSKVLKSGA